MTIISFNRYNVESGKKLTLPMGGNTRSLVNVYQLVQVVLILFGKGQSTFYGEQFNQLVQGVLML